MADGDDGSSFQIVARWHGTIVGRGQQYFRREPGGFGMLASPNHVQTTDVAVTLREEIDIATGLRQAVVEQLDWKSRVSELYYINPDESHVPAGAGGSFTRSFSEQDVQGKADAATTASLEKALAVARAHLQELEDQRTQYDRAVGQAYAIGGRPFARADEWDRARARYHKLMSGPPLDRRAGLKASDPLYATSPVYLEAKRNQYQALQDLGAVTPSYQSVNAEWNALIEKHANLRAQRMREIIPSFVSKYTPEQMAAKAKNRDFSDEEMREGREYEERIAAAREMFAAEDKHAQRVMEASWQAVQAAHRDAHGEWDIKEARERIRELERSLAEARRSGHVATAEAGITTGEDGKTKAYVSMKFPGSRSLSFPVDIIPLRHVGLATELATHYKPTLFDAVIPGLGAGFSGESEVQDGDVTVSYEAEKQWGQPGLIGGGQFSLHVSFKRTPLPMHIKVSLSAVSEIAPSSLQWFDSLGLQVSERWEGMWDPTWVTDIQKFDAAHPLDRAFSNSKHFRFMNVLAVFVETSDQVHITRGDFLLQGPHGERTEYSSSAFGKSAKTFAPTQGGPRKITVDGIDVMVFEQTIGSETWAPSLSHLTKFPPIWTRLRIGLSADNRRALEVFDWSYFPRHQILEDGIFCFSQYENEPDWFELGWGPLDFDASLTAGSDAELEAWWRMTSGQITSGQHSSAQGNPWNISK